MNPPPSDRENGKSDYGSEGLKFESSRVRNLNKARSKCQFRIPPVGRIGGDGLEKSTDEVVQVFPKLVNSSLLRFLQLFDFGETGSGGAVHFT
jgi:hypothetical protein